MKIIFATTMYFNNGRSSGIIKKLESSTSFRYGYQNDNRKICIYGYFSNVFGGHIQYSVAAEPWVLWVS